MGQRPGVICLGSAESMGADLAAAAALGIEPGPWVLVAVNHAAKVWPGPLPHWATLHGDSLRTWTMQRQRLGLPPAGRLWTAERRGRPVGIEVETAPNWGGSSGLLAVSVALNQLRAERVVLCGIPMDIRQGHFDQPGKLWTDGGNYRHAWLRRLAEMKDRVRSMSGWTREQLGAPDREWLDG